MLFDLNNLATAVTVAESEEDMTRKEMDKLNVGDKVEVKKYNTITGKYEWLPAIVSQVLVCSDGGKFAHGGYHSVSAKVNGFTETLDNELTRLSK